MNRDEAKQILMLYRPGSADGQDPQVAEALIVAKGDAELSRWLAEHSARQTELRKKFRQMTAPAGLMEQIISEEAANRRMALDRRRFTRLVAAGAAVLLVLISGVFLMNQPQPREDSLAMFKQEMARYALRGYVMDLQTQDVEQVRNYLQLQHAPADFGLSKTLEQAGLLGCSVEDWKSSKVSMVCFRTGKPLPPGVQNDLWLFVADDSAVADTLPGTTPVITKVNRLTTATWTKNGKLYLLGTTADESVLHSFL